MERASFSAAQFGTHAEQRFVAGSTGPLLGEGSLRSERLGSFLWSGFAFGESDALSFSPDLQRLLFIDP